MACGADGIMVEVHPDPQKALCDGPQSLRIEDFAKLMEGCGNSHPLTKRSSRRGEARESRPPL